YAPQQIGAARTDEPGEAENLAGPQLQRRPPQPGRAGYLSQFEHDITAMVTAPGIKFPHLAAGHRLDDSLQAGLRHPPAIDRLAILEHGVALGDLPALLEKMTDVDDAHPLAAQPPNGLE